MGRRLEYEVKTSVRLNMSNPQHVKINDVIQNLDPKIFKSKNQFIIDAIQFYIDNYGKETFVIKKKEKERAEYIRSEDIDDIKEEVIEAATNEATYEQFMMLGDAELSRRFSMQDEAEQKAKIDREQANELEYVDESQKADSTAAASGSSGNAGGKPVRNPEREKPKWEDTITNRMLHWSYTPEQKEEVKKALAAGVPKATILTYFYPEVTVEKMSSYRKKH